MIVINGAVVPHYPHYRKGLKGIGNTPPLRISLLKESGIGTFRMCSQGTFYQPHSGAQRAPPHPIIGVVGLTSNTLSFLIHLLLKAIMRVIHLRIVR